MACFSFLLLWLFPSETFRLAKDRVHRLRNAEPQQVKWTTNREERRCFSTDRMNVVRLESSCIEIRFRVRSRAFSVDGSPSARSRRHKCTRCGENGANQHNDDSTTTAATFARRPKSVARVKIDSTTLDNTRTAQHLIDRRRHGAAIRHLDSFAFARAVLGHSAAGGRVCRRRRGT